MSHSLSLGMAHFCYHTSHEIKQSPLAMYFSFMVTKDRKTLNEDVKNGDN